MSEERTFDGDDRNVYYSPEACGLRLVGQLEDANASYDFDTVIVVQDIETGAVYAGHDSGCSCPCPFEDVTSLGDLTRVRSVDELRSFVEAKAAEASYAHWPQDERADLYRKTRTALRRKGARA